jgi:penicillin-insensitive murein endopeptidase
MKPPLQKIGIAGCPGRRRSIAAALIGLLALGLGGGVLVSLCHATSDEPSVCFGSTAAGALENGWLLPIAGENFRAYSDLGWGLGRVYVHSAVHALVLDAYARLAESLPDRVFVYGETGLARGGKFSPHHTHQNGLSVDFMVPVLDAQSKPVTLPTRATNRFGYDLNFDRFGKGTGLSIDFDAIAAHLLALKQVASTRQLTIGRVIFAPDLLPHLQRTLTWAQIADLPFQRRSSWVRHDDHYHVDFNVSCRALGDAAQP